MNKILSNQVKNLPFIWAVFFFSFNTINAQCPTIPVSPQVICDAAGFNFNDLNTFATATPGNTVRWYLNPTGGSPLPQSQLVQQGTYYAGDPTGSCGIRSPLVVDFTVNPSGQTLDDIFCSNESPTIQSYINETLLPNIPMGGSVQIYSDFQLTNQLSPATVLTGNANHFIVFVDASGCRGQIERASTAVFPSPASPAPASVQQFCSDTNPTVADLASGTTDNFNWFENVDGMNNPIPPALNPMQALVDGRTYYVQANNFFCDTDAIPVLVEINDPVNAGVNNSQEYCEDNIPMASFDLFPLLGPLADSGGTWTGSLPTTNGDQGTVDISGESVGVYNFVYTVTGIGTCPQATATITIEILEILSSGTASTLSPVSFCTSQLPAAYDLNLLLDNEDIGGLWTMGTTSADPVVVSPIDLTAFSPGNYNFTYSQNVSPNPCPENSTTVSVIVLEDPDAGNAVPTEFCENDLIINSPYDLFNSLDGSQDNNGGTWTDAMNTTILNPIDISRLNIAGSPYTFTYTIDNGFCQDSQAIIIEVLPAPESGNYAGTPFTVCEDQTTANSPYDLFNLLDGTQDTNGIWFAGISSTGTAVTNPIDLTALGSGTFNFTYSIPDIGTCSDVDVTVTVVVNPLPNTGTPTPLLLCENDLVASSPLDLFGQLVGQDPGGTWSDDDFTGALTGSNVDLTGFAVGDYDFSYSITDANGCVNATVVTITVALAPESGNYIGTPFTVCEDQTAANSPYDLFNLLDGTQDTNGTWFAGSNSTGTAVTNPIDLTILGSGSFNFTYSIPDIGTCSDVDVTVTVVVNPLPNTGTPTPLLLCENDLVASSPLDLFGQLAGQDAGGTWSDDDFTGALTGSNVDLTGFAVGDYDFSYSITDANGCVNATVVTITVAPAPESGNYIGTPLTVCEDQTRANSPYDLFNLLDGTQDTIGTWFAGSNSTGTAVTNPIDLTILGSGSFDFTYSVPDIGTCSDVDVTVTIVVNPLPNTGTPTPLLLCENDLVANSPVDLFNQLSGQDAGGMWSDEDTTGSLSGSIVDLTMLTVGTFDFSYSITDSIGCSSFTVVTITVEPAPESGNYIGTPFTVCEDQTAANSPYDLFNLLDGTQDTNGTWFAGSNSTGTAVTNPIDLTILGSGTFNFTYSVPDIGTCSDVDVTVTVVVNPLPNTGTPTPLLLCENDLVASSPLDLFGQLVGQDLGGTWSDDDFTGALTGSNVDLTGFAVDDYDFSYSITDANGCVNATVVTITVAPAPESGNYIGTPLTVCEDQTRANSPYDLFNLLDGTQDNNGTWFAGSNSTGTAVTNPIDLTTLGNGTFDFTYSVPDIGTCSDVDVTVTVVVNPLPNTGTPTPLLLCENDLVANSPVDLFNQLSGQDAGGMWSDEDATGSLNGSIVDLTMLTVGTFDFSYSITDSIGCSSFTVVTITVAPAPESGNYIGAPFTVCEDQTAANSPYDLFNLLDGTQDTNGTWFAGSNSTGTTVTNPIDLTTLGNGTFDFTYSVPDIGTCSDVDVTVTVVVNELTNAGVASPFVVCANELTNNSPLDLFGQLTGQDSGGTWSDVDATGALTGSNVDLTGFAIGNYDFTYTVNNGSCSSSQTVLVTVISAPNAGTASNFDICLSDINSGQTLDLFNQLINNDLGGMWSDDDTTGALNGSILDLNNIVSGTYNFTYTVSPSANCNADSETVQIIINDIAAPTAPAVQDFCDQATVADLTSTGNSVLWYEDASLSTLLNSTDVLIDGEDYFATQIDGITNCESNDSVAITVNVFVSPNSGSPVPLTTCNDQSMVDLTTALDGTQDATGIWIDTDGTGAVNGNIFDATAVSDGSYNFEYQVTGNAPCADASTIVTIIVESPVNAGTDATLDACADNGTTDLFTLLGTSVTTGGTWSPTLASGTGIFDPMTDTSDTYTYTVSNSCNTSTSDVVVTVTDAPNAGTDNMITVCVVDGTIDLLTQLGGSPDDSGVWSPLLNSGSNIFDPAVDGTGVFVYTVAATGPCSTDAVATLNIQVDESPAPTVVNASIDFCETDNPTVIDLDGTVTGTMIFWYDALGSTIPLAGTDSLINGATYFASQTGANGCESSERVEVLVNINDAPTPSLSADGELFCINDSPTLQQLTLNIIEFDPALGNVVWYSSINGTIALPLSTIMTNGTTYYAVLLDPLTGCESSIRLAVTVDLSACGNLVIPDGFSPNGDGVNDVFDIDNLDFLYPNFSLEFYNRYGNLVHEGTANTPRFNGFSNQSALLNDGELPVGVYYYILKYNDGTTKPRQGRIYLSR